MDSFTHLEGLIARHKSGLREHPKCEMIIIIPYPGGLNPLPTGRTGDYFWVVGVYRDISMDDVIKTITSWYAVCDDIRCHTGLEPDIRARHDDDKQLFVHVHIGERHRPRSTEKAHEE